MASYVGNTLSRKDFLKLSGVGLAGMTLLGTSGCGGGDQQEGGGPKNLTFTFGPDEVVPDLVDRFNKQNEGKIKVTYREMPADSGQYLNQIKTEFQAGASEIDVMAGDVIWPAQLAASGWVTDLSDRFTEDMRKDFLSGPLQAFTYEGKVWGVPWQGGAGMLYYRKDLLEKSGFSEPPKTWEELKEQARQVKQDSGIQNGFVFQGAQYEGGTVNGLEYIWTHGGDVLDPGDPSKVVIGSPSSVEALRTERSMMEAGVAPKAVTTYKETESQAAFLRGDAVFLRYWPNAYALLTDETQSNIKPEQVGIAPLPVASEGNQSFNSLGGWGMLISASTPNKDAAWEFIEFMTAPEQLKYRALKGGYLPTRESLYDDQELLEEVRVMEIGRESIENARPRPVSPYYADMSLEMAGQFNASLNGDVPPKDAVDTLQSELSRIVEQGGGA